MRRPILQNMPPKAKQAEEAESRTRTKRSRNPSALAIQSMMVDDFFEESAPKKRRGRPPGRRATAYEPMMDRPPQMPGTGTFAQPTKGAATPTTYEDNPPYQLSSVNALMGSELQSALPRSVYGTRESMPACPSSGAARGHSFSLVHS